MINASPFGTKVAPKDRTRTTARAGRPGIVITHLMHVAAGLLFVVSALTAFYGASVVRPDQKAVAILTAAGSVLALAAIEKRLLANIVAPTASSVRLLICMAPFLAICTFFSAATFFEVHRREIAVQTDREETWARWQQERPRFVGFQTATVTLLRTAQVQEQMELASPVPEGTSRTDASAARRQHRNRIATLQQAEKLASQMPVLPLTPKDTQTADAALVEAYGWAQRVALTVPLELITRINVPVPEARTPRADDVVSVLIRETSGKTPTAAFAWGAAIFVECLPFLCLLAATPGVAVSTRLRRARTRWASLGPALRSPLARVDVPFRVPEVGMTGVVKLQGDIEHLQLTDFLASLEDFYPAFEQKVGREVREVVIVDDQGDALGPASSLAQALAGGPLLLELP